MCFCFCCCLVAFPSRSVCTLTVCAAVLYVCCVVGRDFCSRRASAVCSVSPHTKDSNKHTRNTRHTEEDEGTGRESIVGRPFTAHRERMIGRRTRLFRSVPLGISLCSQRSRSVDGRWHPEGNGDGPCNKRRTHTHEGPVSMPPTRQVSDTTADAQRESRFRHFGCRARK